MIRLAARLALPLLALPMLAGFSPAGGRSPEQPAVDTALVLAVDISQSMDEHEQRVQRDGYVAAIASPEFVRAIRGGGRHRRIALAFVEWGGVAEQFVVVDWRIIGDAAAAEAFAAELAAAPLRSVQRTSISAAIGFSAALFDTLPAAAERRVVDISGDGPNNQGATVTVARDAAVAKGVVINGLPLMISEGSSWYHLPNLDAYYEDCVIGGPGAFVIPVRSIAGFAEAVQTKLVTEIAAAPPGVTRPVAARATVPCNLFD